MSDKAIQDALDAGRVPDSVDRNKLYESTDDQTIAAIIFVGILTTLVVAIRIFSRAVIVKKVGLDDILAIVGLITLIAFIVLCVILIRMGSGRHFEYVRYVMPLSVVEDSEIVDYAAHLIYTTSLLAGRYSGLAFYYWICGRHTYLRISIFVALGVITAGYIPQMLLIVFHCLPVTGLWPYEWQPGAEKYKCLEWGLVYGVNSATSLVCDFLIFGIPIAMLIMMTTTRKRKVQLTCILLPGILVIGISITRLVFVIKGQWEADMSWSYNPMLAIEVSEIGANLIALSVPALKPVIDQMRGKLRDNTKVSYGSTRSHFHPHSQHISSTENLKESSSSRVRSGRGGDGRRTSDRDYELDSNGSVGSMEDDGTVAAAAAGVQGRYGRAAGLGKMGHMGTVVTGGLKTEGSETRLGSKMEGGEGLRPGSDAILVKVAFEVDEERGGSGAN